MAIVRVDGHVQFRGKYYSVEDIHIGKEVTIIATDKQVTIYLKGSLLEVHDRVVDPNKSKSTKSHHLGPWYRALEGESHYLKRAETGLGLTCSGSAQHDGSIPSIDPIIEKLSRALEGDVTMSDRPLCTLDVSIPLYS